MVATESVRGRFRLRPAQRLSGADVTRAVGRGRTRSAGDLRLHYVSNELPFGRIAQIVPKRLARRAVDRGRLRRQAREAFRLNQARWTGYDCVVRLRAALKPDAAADAERARQLANLFERGP